MSGNPQEVPVSDRPAAATSRILVVDDQPANIQVVGGALGRLGHEIIPASDGPTALRRMALRPPDLVLLDLLMPEMDGCEVCRRIRQNPEWKDIPVIFLSAADDKNFIVRALESGGVDYVTKPFNQAELLSRVKTHLALKAASDRLRQLAEDKDELLGILAHDLKSHLGGIQMSADLLRDRVSRAATPDDRTVQLAGNIAHNSGQLLGFVKEFLANSAADHGVPISLKPVNLGDIARAVVQQYRESARRKELTIHAEIPGSVAPALADASALNQVLDNLLSNALKFSPAGKAITVSVTVDERHVGCCVRDQGPGFTAEDRQRMFRRYGRLSARPTGGEPSTGLGLSIVRKLVQAMGGELVCDSVPGEGAAFTVRLARPVK